VTVPPGLASLCLLRVLDISDNYLGSATLDELQTIEFPPLKLLNVSRNRLSSRSLDVIIRSLGRGAAVGLQLSTLLADQNDLDSFPTSLGYIPAIRELSLAGNKIRSIPSDLRILEFIEVNTFN
jgi:Leucine-rich repeat (LRR) protein